MAAVEDARIASRQLRAGDLATVEALIRQARTWALMDSLASDVAGAIALRDPSSWPRIDAWAGDGDFWVCRAALLALLPGIRAGQPDLGRGVVQGGIRPGGQGMPSSRGSHIARHRRRTRRTQ